MDDPSPKPLLRVGGSNNSKNFGKKPTTKTPNAPKGKYSMDRPRENGPMMQPKITKSLVPIPPGADQNQTPNGPKKPSAKDFKAEIVRSLNSNIMKETLAQSPALANAIVKTSWKKSDQEMMALLDGRELEKEEVRKIRLAEQQATVRFNAGGVDGETGKELKKIFNAKLAANSSLMTSTGTITSTKFMDWQKNSAPTAPSAASNLIVTAKTVKNSLDDKKQYALSTMASHRDIVRSLKKQNPEQPQTGSEPVEEPVKRAPKKWANKTDVVVSDFLINRVREIKQSVAPKPRTPKLSQPKTKDNEFELEIYIGESRTTRKLMEEASSNTKRKREDEAEGGDDGKRSKTIDDLPEI